MVSVLTSRTADRGFELQSGQIKDYEISFFSLFIPKARTIKRQEQIRVILYKLHLLFNQILPF